MATIKDVAKLAGVSIATVSRVLNSSAVVKEPQKKKVTDAVAKLGFKPNVFARRLAGGRLNAIGLIIPGYEGIFYSFYAQQIIRNVGLGLERCKKDLLLHINWGKDNFNTEYIEGVIFSDVLKNEAQLERIVQEQLPCAVINKRLDNAPVSYFAVDNVNGAYEATKYLIGLGHKKIAHITGDMNAQCAQDRKAGYEKALKEAGITVPASYVQIGDFSRNQAHKSTEFLMNMKDRPTAIFCASDDMAYEAMLFLLEKGIKIPDEISLVGFDENPQYFYAPLSITTVYQPIDEMVKEAVDYLDRVIASGKPELVQKNLPTKLVIGDTTGPAPKTT
jgi:DNA-binding LacI/PurR family transcriptional regulator